MLWHRSLLVLVLGLSVCLVSADVRLAGRRGSQAFGFGEAGAEGGLFSARGCPLGGLTRAVSACPAVEPPALEIGREGRDLSPHRRYGGGRESDSHRNASSRIDYTLDHQWSAVDFSASNSAPEEGTPVGRDHRNRGGDDAVQERRREALGGNRSHLGCLLDWTVEEPEPTVDPDAIGEDPAPQSPGDPTPATHTPEPGSLVLFGLGLGAALTRARRRRVAGSAEGM